MEGVGEFAFEVSFDQFGVKEKVGKVVFFYNADTVIANTVQQLYLIVGLSVIKTFIFWLIINYWGKRLIHTPLSKMTKMCDLVGSEGDQIDYKRQITSDDEMSKLETAFINLIRRIKQLAEISNAKTAFLSNMSHEFRTPLNTIIGYSEIILEDSDLDELNKEEFFSDVTSINTAGKHLLHIVNSALDISKIEAGQMSLALSEVSIDGLAKEIEAIVGSLMIPQRNRFQMEVDVGEDSFYTDIGRLRQVLLNLIGNAAKFTEDGSITLSFTDQLTGGDAELVIKVTDTGMGIATENLERIFEKFIQVHDITKDPVSGTGLGLALSKSLIDCLGGKIEVQSELGSGTTFTVTLPYKDPGKEICDKSLPKTLIVDDDPDIRHYLSDLLSEHFQCDLVGDGQAALSLLAEREYFALFVDLHMVPMDGFELISNIKENGVRPTKVFMMTGSTVSHYLARAESINIDAILEKPFDTEALFTTLGIDKKEAA